MKSHGLCLWFKLVVLVLASLVQGNAAETSLRQVRESPEPSRAVLRVHAQNRSSYAIPKFITGKFAEHLGANIYQGMEAQILRNPTFAEYPFWTGQMTPDGVTRFHSEEEKIKQELRRQAARVGWPEADLENLLAAQADGLACWWMREGSREAVQAGPEAAPQGGRAQRLQVRAAKQGLAQWTYLPLHRVKKYQFEIYARSPDISTVSVSLAAGGEEKSQATALAKGLSTTWQKLQGTLELPAQAPADLVYKFSITAESPGQIVLGRVCLWPADHIGGADPDVVRFLKESRLPLLRWPGGNFVSGYHWEDGIGPVEARPTRPNYAWGAVEPNTFGTDEFIAFCRAVGCEPMICINAGSGTPAEAARWIEYCNGPASSPMGARRAAAGHPEPYHVQHWEVGNELWGRWQYYWTTASGYVDRYLQFVQAMRKADASIKLYACGAPVMWGKQWNDTLLAGAAKQITSITDHPLIGGTVSPGTEPLDVYRDFMDVPEVLEKKWAELQRDMIKAGVEQPRLAVTELQMFAHIGGAKDSGAPVRLTHENLVNPGTLAEGIYDVLIYHAAVRLAPFVEMVTHSATVNHGGGLRKERQRVYANPCFYAQSAFAAFAGAIPVNIELECAMERAPGVLADLKNAAPGAFGSIDALAALGADGSLLVSLVHRGSSGPIRLALELDGFKPAISAEVRTLSADVPWAANSLQNPEAVHPVDSTIKISNQKAQLTLAPYTVARVRFAPEK